MTGKAQVIWLCLGLVIGQLLVFILKYQHSNPGKDLSVRDHGRRY